MQLNTFHKLFMLMIFSFLITIMAVVEGVGLTNTTMPYSFQLDSLALKYDAIDASSFPQIFSLVVVTNKAGIVVDQLDENNFEVYEDNVRELPIMVEELSNNDVDVNVVLAIDRSRSMGGQPIVDAKVAASTFVDLMQGEDKSAVVSFAYEPITNYPFSNNKDSLKAAISEINVNGATAIFDALIHSTDLLKNVPENRVIILMTDGSDNNSQHTYDEALNTLLSMEVRVFTIGLDLEQCSFAENILKDLAGLTGGKYYYSPTSSDLDEIYRAISMLLHHRYRISYQTHNPAKDGKLRHVLINVMVNSNTGSDTASYIAPYKSQPPTATNLTITPVNPKTSDNLIGSYTYQDENGTAEGATEIRWYKDGVHQAAYNDILTVPSQATVKNDNWFFTVKPHNGIEYGEPATSPAVTVGNTAPVASNLSISPGSPMASENIVGSYSFNDADGDLESGTEIRWYKDGVHQPAYDNILTMLSTATTRGEQWYFTVKPRDGIKFGEIVTSPAVFIGNTAPVASNLSISPGSPMASENFSGRYTFKDADGDLESGTEIRWYKDGIRQPAYDDVLSVSFTATAKGERWYFTVKPRDGINFGEIVTSPAVFIGNTAPIASNLSLRPDSPSSSDSLIGSYTFKDADGDLESGTEIRWYKDGVHQAAYDDVLSVSFTATAKGERWYFTVKPGDGKILGIATSSPSVIIGNTAPNVSNLTITPANPLSVDNLSGSYSFNDIDGDSEGASEIRWYKDGVQQSLYDDVLTLPSAATANGERWYFTVRPHDGVDFGDIYTSPDVIIGNMAPTASNLLLLPDNPVTSDNLIGSYFFNDADGDLESVTEIRWYRDGIHQLPYNDVLTIPSTATAKGEQWYFTVKPHDGVYFGEPAFSPVVKIGNTVPTVSNLSILPHYPFSSDNLVANYTFSDADGDSEGATEIRWYKDEVHQSAYDDSSTVPASETAAGERWFFTVKPNDGIEFGLLQESSIVTVRATDSNEQEEELVVIPNPFTPNDDGFNDRTEFRLKDGLPQNCIITIMKRSGQKIKRLTDGKKYWDGKDEMGQMMLPGNYLYMISDGRRVIYRGLVYLIR